MTYNRINGEDIEFVDEEGNVIVPSEESVIYVNRKGKTVDEARAKRALNSGQYIDQRSLYDDRYAPNSERRQQPVQHHRQPQQHQAMQSYNNKVSSHSTQDLITNMHKIFAEARRNAQNQPDISMIESDARSRSNSPAKHYQQHSSAAEFNLQEQLKKLEAAKKLQERAEKRERENKLKEQQRQQKKRQQEYDRQMELQREKQQKDYERQVEQQKQYQKQVEQQQREYYKQMERQQKEYKAQMKLFEAQQLAEAENAKKHTVSQKPPINYQPSSSKNQLNPKYRDLSSAPKKNKRTHHTARSASSKQISNSHSTQNPYSQMQNNYLSGAVSSAYTNNVPSSSNHLNSREVNDSIRNLQKLLSKASLTDKTGSSSRDRSLQPSASKHSSGNQYLSNASHGNLAQAASGTNLVAYQNQQQLQQQMLYQQQQQMMYGQFGDYASSGYADGYYDYGY